MSRFKRIKNTSTKKSSVSIDERIASLNQELKKTGMLSEKMTTGNVLSTSEYVPPQEYKEGEVPNSSGIGGEGFSQNSAGSGVAGDPPNHSDMSDLYNSDVGHPIYKSTSYGGVGSFGIVIGPSFGAGTSYGIIENGNIYRQVLGAFLAGGTRGPGNYESVYRSYLQTNEQSPGFYSQEQIDQALENWQLAVQVHAILVEIGFDNSRFNVPWKGWRKAILFEDLSGTPTFNHPTKGTIHLVTFNLLGMPNTYAEQDARPPGTTNPQRRGLEDDPIFPGPIATLFGLGQRAFDWLRGKAEDRKKKRGGGKPNRPGSGFPDPKPEPDPTEPDPTKPEPDPEKDYERNRRDNRPEVTGKMPDEFVKDVKNALKKEIDDLNKFVKNSKVIARRIQTVIQAIPTSANAMNAWVRNNKPDHPDYRKNDPRSPNYEGPYEAKADAKWKDVVGSQLKKSLPTDLEYKRDMKKMPGLDVGVDGYTYEGPTWSERLKNSPDGKIELNAYEIAVLSKKMKPEGSGGAVHNGDMRFHTLFNSLPPETTTVTLDSEGNMEIVSNYRFTDRDDVSSGGEIIKNYITNVANPPDPKKYEKNRGKKKTEKTGKTFDFYDKAGKDKKKIGEVHDTNLMLKLNINGNNKSNWPTAPAKGRVKESLDESVGLGLYEPEAMNVNLADIRKGVMPEYPKKPPAEMIDGYHEKSRIRPKKAKNEEPYLKIDKKDLIRSHRLKKSEADEMMNTINMINDYIRDNPADLIHAQMRYPVDDPRLAELNWKMDQMLEAGEKYMDSNFKENKKLYKRAMDRTKNNIKLTDPEYVQQKYDELRGTPKPKKSINKRNVSRFFKKPTKKKSSMEEIDDKIKQLDKDLLL